MQLLTHQQVGTGPNRVLVMNDWLCDTSTWESAHHYLDRGQFTWVFADLRGYGRSREFAGPYTLAQCAADVLKLADFLEWPEFSVVGHSMSSLIALHLAQHVPDRIRRAVVLTPPPPQGLGVDDAMLAGMQQLALANDADRLKGLKQIWGDRLSDQWIAYKAERWRATTDARAAAAYVAMFGRDGLPDPAMKIRVPVMAVTGEQDMPVMHKAAVSDLLSPICDSLTVQALSECGHYPMQEMPPLLVTLVERFLASADPAA
jgi:pimeloyl-ACP methyl ester carboxylesterase